MKKSSLCYTSFTIDRRDKIGRALKIANVFGFALRCTWFNLHLWNGYNFMYPMGFYLFYWLEEEEEEEERKMLTSISLEVNSHDVLECRPDVVPKAELG